MQSFSIGGNNSSLQFLNLYMDGGLCRRRATFACVVKCFGKAFERFPLLILHYGICCGAASTATQLYTSLILTNRADVQNKKPDRFLHQNDRCHCLLTFRPQDIHSPWVTTFVGILIIDMFILFAMSLQAK